MGRQYLQVPEGDYFFVCDKCNNFLTSSRHYSSDAFTGNSGKAILFTAAYNVLESKVERKHMTTGIHLVRDVMCGQCKTKIGWMYELAYNPDQEYKEGQFILEWKYIRCLRDPQGLGLDEDLPPYMIHNRDPETPEIMYHPSHRINRNPRFYHR